MSEIFQIPTLDKNPVKHLRHLREKYASVERRLRAGEPQRDENAQNPNPTLPTLDKDNDKEIPEIEPQVAEKAEQHCHNSPTLDKDPLTQDIPKEPKTPKKSHNLRILEKIGRGVFGKVYRVEDKETRETSALKIVTDNMYRSTELDVLKLLKKLNGDRYHCIPLLRSYRTNSERLFQFPLYAYTIYKFMKSYSPKGLSIPEVYKIMKQICTGIAFLHRNGIFHADLKPDNIMFLPSETICDYDKEGCKEYTRMADPKIMLIDFGHAKIMRSDDPIGLKHKVCCKTYRPPECLLQLSVSYPVDVWCAGLICFFLYCGEDLFRYGYTRLELLAQTEKVFGKFPERLTETVAGGKLFLNGFLKKPANSKTFRYSILSKVSDFNFYNKSRSGNSDNLFKFMQTLLKIDPLERMTMEEVIKQQNWQ